MKARPVVIGAAIGAFIGALLMLPPAMYFFSPDSVLTTIVFSGGLVLTGILFCGGLGAAVVGAVRADRRNGGYRCHGARM